MFRHLWERVGWTQPEKYDNSKAIVPFHYFDSLMLEIELKYIKGMPDKFAVFQFEDYQNIVNLDKMVPELEGYETQLSSNIVVEDTELDKGKKILILYKDILHPYPEKVHLFMGGSGGYYSYYLGIASVLQENFNLDNVIFSGVSGGTIVNLFLALGISIETVFKDWNVPLLKSVAQFKFGALFNWNQACLEHFHRMVPDDAYQTVKGRYFVYSTEFYFTQKWKNRMIGDWDNNEELGKAVLASCQVPILLGGDLYTIYRNEKFIDGCVTYRPDLNNHKHIPTIKIYANTYRDYKHIWFWPWTSEEWHRQIYEWGRDDAIKNLDYFKQFLMPKK